MESEEAKRLAAAALKVPLLQVEVASISRLASLWAGMGSVFEILLKGEKTTIVCKKISMPAGNRISVGDQRKKDSYEVEARFYEAFSCKLLEAGVLVPTGYSVCFDNDTLIICMSKLPGKTLSSLDECQSKIAARWAAKLHAYTWGKTADECVNIYGLQPQGTYWYLDTRKQEWEAMPNQGWEGRLRIAARAIDERLKADPFQCIVHGDFKAHNMIMDQNNVIGLCDFQYCGKACSLKDICYMITCYCKEQKHDQHTAHSLEKIVLDTYYNELVALLTARNQTHLESQCEHEILSIPPRNSLQDAADLCFADLCRWMTGWGYWGNTFLIPRTQLVLNRIDKGIGLSSESEYREAVFLAYPVGQ